MLKPDTAFPRDAEFLDYIRSFVDESRLSRAAVDRLFALARRVAEAAAEIERLRAELEQCQQTLYRQIGLTIDASEEATKASSAEIERLRAALREIDQQRYTGRNTINPDNAYEMAVAINAKLLAVMDIAHTALKEDGDE